MKSTTLSAYLPVKKKLQLEQVYNLKAPPVNMSKDKSPAYQWYPKDILTSYRVDMMTLAEEGAYRRALDKCWLNGWLPNDAAKLAKVIGKNCSINIARGIMGMFLIHPEDPTKLIHDRQEMERDKQAAFREKQSENGKKGGRPGKESQKKGLGFSDESQNDSQKKLSYLLSSSSDKEPPNPQGGIVGEEKFEIEEPILKNFNLSEQNNPQQAFLVHTFCVTLNHRGRIKYFTENFEAYQKLKKANTDRKHWHKNLEKFLGSGREFFEDGVWAKENWMEDLKEFRKTNGVAAGSNVLPGKSPLANR